MRKILTTAALLLALSCPAHAGEIHTPGSPASPPPSPMQEPIDGTTPGGEIPTPPGEEGTPGIIHNSDASGSLAEFALDLLAVLPSIL